MPARLRHTHRPPSARRGFTLLELIISVALVLVLMLAITRIFSITSSAVGASQGLASATRDARAAQAVFSRDIGSMASDSAFIWLKCEEPFSAWRNAADEASDHDHLALTIDLNDNGSDTDPGETVPGFTLSSRRHRLDNFSFIARDRFTRQTGNDAGSIVSPMTTSEAWIYYGPLALPNNDGTFQTGTGVRTDPSAGNSIRDNPNNYYASQWVLGRVAPLMALRGSDNNIRDNKGMAQEFFQKTATRMTPFTSLTTATVSGVTMRNARYDLIDVDNTAARDLVAAVAASVSPMWWTAICNQHFEINPFVQKPISPRSASQQVPLFVSGVSQFLVDYAGDYVTQDLNGAVTATESDGVLDYSTLNGARQIRWYGYPRDVDRDGAINVTLRDTNGDGVLDTTGPDVVPVADFALMTGQLYTSVGNPYKSFEHFTSAAAQTRKTYPATPNFGIYYAAWGPSDTNRPKMYRITMVIDRPELAGRTPDGASFEFVFNAPN